MARSRFVTHWTGKDICLEPAKLTLSHRREYVRRAVDTLRNGLWMTAPGENLRGDADHKITLQVPMTCFTELRLSGSASHRHEYGLLGFVFDRSFLLERGGKPVQYVQNHLDEPLVINFAEVLQWVGRCEAAGVRDAKGFKDALFHNVSFLKPMSGQAEDDFRYLDEHEWRIVQTDSQVAAGRMTRGRHGNNPRFRIPFRAGDVKMLVLPDRWVRDKVRDESVIARWGSKAPALLTVDEIDQL